MALVAQALEAQNPTARIIISKINSPVHKKNPGISRALSSRACAAEGAGGIEPPFAKANMNPEVVLMLYQFDSLS